MCTILRTPWRSTLIALGVCLATTRCAVNIESPTAQTEQPSGIDLADAAIDDLAQPEVDAGSVVDGSSPDRTTPVATDAGSTALDAGERQPYAGTPTTLEVATWNLKNFPTEPGVSEQLLASSILAMDYDIVAVEEIADVTAFATAMAQLPGYSSVVSTDAYWNGSYQKTGVIYRTRTVTVNRIENLFEDSSDAFPRPPLRLDLHVALPAAADGSNVEKDLALVVLHLKAGTSTDSSARRRAAAERIEAYIAQQLVAVPERDLLFAGDFNAKLIDSESADLWPLYDDGTFLTEALETAGVVSYLPYPKLIDHLYTVDRAPLDLANASTLVVPLADRIENYTSVMSDHLPVAAFWTLQQP